MPRKIMLIGLDAVSLTLINQYAESCPTIRKLMKNGVSGRALSELPVYTPTNWAVLCTGAGASKSRQEGWHNDVSGRRLHAFDSRSYACETIFDVCEKNSLSSLAISYPGSYPAKGDRNMVIAPLFRGLKSNCLVPGTIIPVDLIGGKMDFVLPVHNNALDPSVSDGIENEAGAEKNLIVERINASLSLAETGGKLIVRRDGREDKYALRFNEWSGAIPIRIIGDDYSRECSICVNLFDGGKRVAISEVYDLTHAAWPPALADEILNKLGPPVENMTFFNEMIRLFNADEEDRVIFEMARREIFDQAEWISASATIATKINPADVFYIHYHLVDTMLHQCLQAADGSPAFSKRQRNTALEIFKLGVEACDLLVEKLLKLANEETYFLIVSDHGHVPNRYGVSVKNRLIERGITVLDGLGGIDKIKSVAWVSPDVNTWINVNAERGSDEYVSIQDEVIDALLDWKTKDGKRIVVVALKRKDSHLLGYHGPHCGDVAFHFNSGFAWTAKGGDIICDDYTQSNHGPQMPATFSKISDNLAFFTLAGPGVKKDFKWDEEERGYVRLIDFVPTLCKFAGIPAPAGSTGGARLEFSEV